MALDNSILRLSCASVPPFRGAGRVLRYAHACGILPILVFGVGVESRDREDGEECPVCLEVVGEGGGDVSVTDCGHRLHSECLVSLRSRMERCPVCRARI